MMSRSLDRVDRGRTGEDGQALILFVAGLVVFLGFVGLSVDIGRWMWAKGELQASVDSAALAGAQSMPLGNAQAEAAATEYWEQNRDGLIGGEDVSFSVTFPGGNRAVRVSAEARVPTWFVRLFGVDRWHVEASGKAESQVLDIAVVLDVSGSMCFTSYEPVEGDGSSWKGIVMGPGRLNPYGGYPFPQLAEAIPAGGPDTITIKLNSVGVFNTTNTTEKDKIFGDYWSTSAQNGKRYHEIAPNGARAGIIRIDGELFQITAVDPATNSLTVRRGMTNLRTGLATAKTAHAVNAEVWANRSADGSSDYCNMAAYRARTSTVNGPHEPFDSALANAKYFIGLFNPEFDKIGVARYSSTGTIAAGLTGGSFSSLNSAIDAFPYPSGSTNIAHGIARGQAILTGAGSRPNSVRVLVLLTDGVPNVYCTNGYSSSSCSQASSTTPASCPASSTAITHAVNQAAAAKAAGTIVYTIGLGDGVLDCTLEQIAAAGGGEYFKAPTAAQLDDAFRAIAEKTHIGLTE